MDRPGRQSDLKICSTVAKATGIIGEYKRYLFNFLIVRMLFLITNEEVFFYNAALFNE